MANDQKRNPFVIPDTEINDMIKQVSKNNDAKKNSLKKIRTLIRRAKDGLFESNPTRQILVEIDEVLDGFLMEQKKTEYNINNIMSLFITFVVSSGVKLELPPNFLVSGSVKREEEISEGYYRLYKKPTKHVVNVDCTNPSMETISGTPDSLFSKSFVL